ncbi:MAG: hypothetical protein IKY90_07610, partial [Oscillospiraceae bacterium]|nr:hypothetical protein [Oscillospiraceae bacterium]
SPTIILTDSQPCLARFHLGSRLRIFGITDASYGKPAKFCFAKRLIFFAIFVVIRFEGGSKDL